MILRVKVGHSADHAYSSVFACVMIDFVACILDALGPGHGGNAVVGGGGVWVVGRHWGDVESNGGRDYIPSTQRTVLHEPAQRTDDKLRVSQNETAER